MNVQRRLLIAVLAIALLLCGCSQLSSQEGQPQQPKESVAEQSQEPEQKAPAHYPECSWKDMAEVSKRIAAAGSDEEARQIAKDFGLANEDGSITDQTKMILINENQALDVRPIGFRHDDLSDGSGKAGLTFMSVGAIALRPMNAEDTVEGGWEASELRAWLNSEGLEMLDPELRDVIMSVDKRTNNSGRTLDLANVTPTSDKLWVFSPREVCGDIHWDSEEYRGRMGWEDVDAMFNAEGEQYEAFARAGVTCNSDPNGFLSLESSTGASPWWYRTLTPFEWYGYGPTGTNGYFCQVRDSGYPESQGLANVPAAVVFGFCV